MDKTVFRHRGTSERQVQYHFESVADLINELSNCAFGHERRCMSEVVRSRKFYAWLRRIGEKRFAREFEPFSRCSMGVYTEAARIVFENLESNTVDFSKVVGMGGAKTLLLEMATCPKAIEGVSKRYGRTSSGCILLYGPPGCGKTFLAKALAGETSKHFIQRGLFEMAEGHRSIFTVARKLGGAVLFIDEMEALAQDRDSEGLNTRFLTNSLLSELNDKRENTGIVLIGTTNEPWVMDTAMIRSGRMDNLVYIGVPDAKTRHALFKFYTKGLPVEKFDFSSLVERTDFFSCSDIEALCYEAGAIPWREAVRGKGERRISSDDFEKALKRTESTAIPWFEDASNVFFSPSLKSRFAPMVAEIERFRRFKGA